MSIGRAIVGVGGGAGRGKRGRNHITYELTSSAKLKENSGKMYAKIGQIFIMPVAVTYIKRDHWPVVFQISHFSFEMKNNIDKGNFFFVKTYCFAEPTR